MNNTKFKALMIVYIYLYKFDDTENNNNQKRFKNIIEMATI